MKVKVSSILNSDGSQRFRHTFVNLYVKGENWGVANLPSIYDHQVGFMTQRGTMVWEGEAVVDLDLEIEVVMPHTQWKQLGCTTICYQRKPARQWKRSLSEGTHGVLHGVDLIPSNRKIHQLPERYPGLQSGFLPEIAQILENKPISFTEGVKCLSDPKYHSVALENGFLLGHEGSLFLEATKIAKFYFKQKSYKVHPLFAEELRDLTKGHIFKAIEEEKYEN